MSNDIRLRTNRQRILQLMASLWQVIIEIRRCWHRNSRNGQRAIRIPAIEQVPALYNGHLALSNCFAQKFHIVHLHSHHWRSTDSTGIDAFVVK